MIVFTGEMLRKWSNLQGHYIEFFFIIFNFFAAEKLKT